VIASIGGIGAAAALVIAPIVAIGATHGNCSTAQAAINHIRVNCPRIACAARDVLCGRSISDTERPVCRTP